MKVERLTDDKLIVFLNKIYLKKNNFSLKNNLEKYFKNLFIKLSEFYDIEIKGFYDITIYQDYSFGVILEIVKEDLDLYGYYDDHIDMKIKIMKKEKIMFCLDRLGLVDSKTLNCCRLYFYQDKFYIVPKRTITDINMGIILENSKILYGEKVLKILNKAHLLNSKKVFI